MSLTTLSSTASLPAASSSWLRTSDSSPYRVLWRLLMVSPSGLPQWVSVRAPSEAEAVSTLAQARPEWTIERIERERNP